MKKILFMIISVMWILFFILYPSEAFAASKNGLMLWAAQILPALLPYSLLSGFLLSSGIFSGKRKSSEWFIIFCGFLFGFPMGSRLSSDFYEKKLLSRKRAQLLCAFTNNMSPVFVSTFVLESQYRHPELTSITFALLYGVPLVWGLIRLWGIHRRYPYQIKKRAGSLINRNIRKNPANTFDLNIQIIDAGILKSFETMIRLCGYIVIFSIMSGMLRLIPFPKPWMAAIFAGILECTNGIAAIAACPLPFSYQYLLSVAVLSLGGISGIAQTGSMIRDCGLSLGTYIKDRLLICFVTVITAGLLLRFTGLIPI